MFEIGTERRQVDPVVMRSRVAERRIQTADGHVRVGEQICFHGSSVSRMVQTLAEPGVARFEVARIQEYDSRNASKCRLCRRSDTHVQ